MTAQSMSLTMNSLADLDHPENLNLELQTGKSIIYAVYLIAILFYGNYFKVKMRKKSLEHTRIEKCTHLQK